MRRTIQLKAPEATGWRWSVWYGASGARGFMGHAMGWIDAQQLVAEIIDAQGGAR